jgi:nitrite reductase/ring-hydroxylating ferredoxin subunit
MELLRLAAITDIPPGELKQFDIKGKELLVVSLNNQFYCLNARCTHAGAPLAEGALKGEVLTCPWHGSRFNVTDGSVLGGPAKKPLGTYKTVIQGDQLFIEAAAL